MTTASGHDSEPLTSIYGAWLPVTHADVTHADVTRIADDTRIVDVRELPLHPPPQWRLRGAEFVHATVAVGLIVSATSS